MIHVTPLILNMLKVIYHLSDIYNHLYGDIIYQVNVLSLYMYLNRRFRDNKYQKRAPHIFSLFNDYYGVFSLSAANILLIL